MAQEEEAASPTPAVVKPSAVPVKPATVKPVTVKPKLVKPEAVKADATVFPPNPSSFSFDLGSLVLCAGLFSALIMMDFYR